MRIGLISDFNIDVLSRILQSENKTYEIISFPFGQVYQSLMSVAQNRIPTSCYIGGNDSAISEISNERIENLIVWTRPESILKEFSKLLNFEEVNIDKLLNEVDEFSTSLISSSKAVGNIFIMSWEKPLYHTGYGMSDYQSGVGLSYFINIINNRLSENISNISNIYILDTQKYFNSINNIYNNKMWYASKTAYSLEVFKKVKEDIYSCIDGLAGKSRRLIVVDLDNTLWGGILGDLGWEGVKIGGHDYMGEAFADFQTTLKSLTNRGLLLAIASKNYEEVALEAINKNPEMILKENDFSSWKINWQDKAQNIIDIAKDVNLGLSSIVFIDDNPAERARVAEALPEVYVPEWPENPVDYKEALLSLTCFNNPSITKEDRARSKMFVQNRERRDLSNSLSHDEWLKSIEMEVEIEELNTTNSTRTAQLLNKTNQFNMATRRMSESEFIDWTKQDSNKMFTFKVKDKFGDSGLTGVISFSIEKNKLVIKDFIMSCRVMGREIERLMLGYVAEEAIKLKINKIEAIFLKTNRNKPMYDFLNNSGFKKHDNEYIWDCKNNYEIPSFINIVKK